MSRLSGHWTRIISTALLSSTILMGCASSLMDKPTADFVPAEGTSNKFAAINRTREAPVVYVKLDGDVLRPKKQSAEKPLPMDVVGPYELRDEALPAALELVLAGKNIPIALQSQTAMQRTVTVTSLSGPLDEVVDKLCSLADVYCSYEKNVLVIKDTETFTVSLPPMISDNYEPFVNGLKVITGGDTYVDTLTRSLVYSASHRNHMRAVDYFDRLRANTAMIIYEVQIWEVQLTDGTKTGIDWEQLSTHVGNVALNLARDGSPGITGGVGIGAQYTSSDLSFDAVLSFLRTQGAVKTISQPQISVLSGSQAKLRVGNKRDYVSQITRTVGVNTADNVSVTTSKLETGLNLDITSAWDNGTVYGDLKIALQNLINLDSLDVGTTSIQLPETSDRTVETKIRVRPGDAVLIGGIVEQRDDMTEEGPPGIGGPLFTTNKEKNARNSELVFMLRPRVVVYTDTLPEAAQLQAGGMVAEPARLQNTASALGRNTDTLRPTPLPALSDYVGQLPVDQIAPTQ